MTSQLIQFTEMFGRGRILLRFGIDDSWKDDTYSEISQTIEVLRSSKIITRLQFPKDLDDWTQRMLLASMDDFRVAVVLRGIVCAIDLARLIIHTIENDADLACGVDLQFDRNYRIPRHSASLDLRDNTPIPTEDILRASTYIQVRNCDASVKVLSFKAMRSTYPCYLQHLVSGHIIPPKSCQSSAKVMISPSVKTSPNPEDFRTAIQLGFMDMQGFDYHPLDWDKCPHVEI